MAQDHPASHQKKAAEDGGVVLFEDECIFQQSGSILRSWFKRGVGGDVKSKPGRRNCKVYGAVSVHEKEPKFHFRFEKDKFNAYSFVCFLEGVIRYYKRRGQKVHMIVDGVGYHTAALVWIANFAANDIELHFLPPYSPQLNAAEQLWRRAKREATHNRFFPTLQSLHRAVFRRFNRWQGNPAALRGIVKRWL